MASLGALFTALLAFVVGATSPGLAASDTADDTIPAVAEHVFELGSGHGFTGLRTDYDNRSITVHWKGAPPDAVLNYVKSRPYGVTITVVADAKYSRAEGNAARERLLADPVAKQIGIVSASVDNDGSGLSISVTADQRTADSLTAAVRAAATIDDVTIEAGVPEPVGYPGRIHTLRRY